MQKKPSGNSMLQNKSIKLGKQKNYYSKEQIQPECILWPQAHEFQYRWQWSS